MTPPEVLAFRQQGGAANGPGWDLRVVPNKFPALQVEGTLDREGEGLFDRMNGIGAHEVIIETPDHAKTLATMSEPEIERILWAFRERILDLKKDRRFRYILIFKNHGAAAGASLEHSHSQLIALPIVPDFVREELEGAKRHYAAKERCVFCDIIRQEIADDRRIIQEDADIIALAPYAPRFAVRDLDSAAPPRSAVRRGAAPGVRGAGADAEVGADADEPDARKSRPTISSFTARRSARRRSEFYHWHVELMPKLTRTAGFEWGTGFYINPTSPEEAAQVLRNARI